MRVGTFVVGLLCAVLVAGLIGVFTAHAFRSGSGASGSATPAPTATTTVTVDGTGLRALVVHPPAGTHEVSFNVGDNGVFTLDQFVKDYFDNATDMDSELMSFEFRWMAERGWIGPDGIEIDDQLIEFDSAYHAQQFAAQQKAAYNQDPRYTSTFQVTGGTGTGYEGSELDVAGFYRASVVGSKDNIAVVLLVFAPGDFNETEESQVLNAQMAALP